MLERLSMERDQLRLENLVYLNLKQPVLNSITWRPKLRGPLNCFFGGGMLSQVGRMRAKSAAATLPTNSLL
jgi:hypothetical protein